MRIGSITSLAVLGGAAAVVAAPARALSEARYQSFTAEIGENEQQKPAESRNIFENSSSYPSSATATYNAYSLDNENMDKVSGIKAAQTGSYPTLDNSHGNSNDYYYKSYSDDSNNKSATHYYPKLYISSTQASYVPEATSSPTTSWDANDCKEDGDDHDEKDNVDCPAPRVMSLPDPMDGVQQNSELLQQLDYAHTSSARRDILEKNGGNDAFVFDFDDPPSDAESSNNGGKVVTGFGHNFPAAHKTGLSLAVYNLGPCGIFLPHLNARADESIIVTEGTVFTQFVTDYGLPSVSNELFTGKSTIFPQGSIHTEFNPTCEVSSFVSAYNSDSPGVTPASMGMDEQTSPDYHSSYLQGCYPNSLKHQLPNDILRSVEQCLSRCGTSTPQTYDSLDHSDTIHKRDEIPGENFSVIGNSTRNSAKYENTTTSLDESNNSVLTTDFAHRRGYDRKPVSRGQASKDRDSAIPEVERWSDYIFGGRFGRGNTDYESGEIYDGEDDDEDDDEYDDSGYSSDYSGNSDEYDDDYYYDDYQESSVPDRPPQNERPNQREQELEKDRQLETERSNRRPAANNRQRERSRPGNNRQNGQSSSQNRKGANNNNGSLRNSGSSSRNKPNRNSRIGNRYSSSGDYRDSEKGYDRDFDSDLEREYESDREADIDMEPSDRGNSGKRYKYISRGRSGGSSSRNYTERMPDDYYNDQVYDDDDFDDKRPAAPPSHSNRERVPSRGRDDSRERGERYRDSNYDEDSGYSRRKPSRNYSNRGERNNRSRNPPGNELKSRPYYRGNNVTWNDPELDSSEKNTFRGKQLDRSMSGRYRDRNSTLDDPEYGKPYSRSGYRTGRTQPYSPPQNERVKDRNHMRDDDYYLYDDDGYYYPTQSLSVDEEEAKDPDTESIHNEPLFKNETEGSNNATIGYFRDVRYRNSSVRYDMGRNRTYYQPGGSSTRVRYNHSEPQRPYELPGGRRYLPAQSNKDRVSRQREIEMDELAARERERERYRYQQREAEFRRQNAARERDMIARRYGSRGGGSPYYESSYGGDAYYESSPYDGYYSEDYFEPNDPYACSRYDQMDRYPSSSPHYSEPCPYHDSPPPCPYCDSGCGECCDSHEDPCYDDYYYYGELDGEGCMECHYCTSNDEIYDHSEYYNDGYGGSNPYSGRRYPVANAAAIPRGQSPKSQKVESHQLEKQPKAVENVHPQISGAV